MIMIEIAKCGIFDSRIKFSGIKRTPERLTENYEIEYYLSGEGFSVIDGESYPHREDRVLFIRPQQRRYSIDAFCCLCLHIKPDSFFDSLLSALPSDIPISSRAFYKYLFYEIIELYSSTEKGKILMLQGKIFELLSTICADSDMNCTPHGGISAAVTEKAVEYMNKNFFRQIDLADIAEYVHLSPIYFHKLFKKSAGMTPLEYLNEQRISAAKRELILSNKSISEIAEVCGFTSQAYFSYAFGKKLGLTPSEYRRQKHINIIF